MTLSLFLLFTVLLFVTLARATVHCETQEQTVRALHAACAADLGCRHFFGKWSTSKFSTLVVKKLQLVRTWPQALSSMHSSFHGDDDARHHFWPQTWRNETPALLTFGAVPVELPDAVSASLYEADCAALATSLAHPATSHLPPSEMRDAVHVLFEYAIFLADERQCNPENEVLVIDPETNEAHCMLAAGHVCASSSGFSDTLASVAISLVIALGALGLIIQSGLGGYAFSKLRKVNAQDRFIPLDNKI